MLAWGKTGTMIRALILGVLLILLGSPILNAADSSGSEQPSGRSKKPAFLEVRRSRRAKIVFAEGRQWAWFEQAELGFGELTLTVGEAHIDSAEGVGELSGGVTLTGPDLIVTSECCTVDGHGAELAFPKPVEARCPQEGISLRAGEAHFYYLPDTHEPYKAVLAGDVEVTWEPGAELQAARMVYRFAPRVLELTEGFQATIAAELLPSSGGDLAGPKIELRGEKLFAQLEGPEHAPTAVILSGSRATVMGQSVQLSAPTLAAELALLEGKELSRRAELVSLVLSGSATAPVTGSWLREDGGEVHFSTQKLEKSRAEPCLTLKGSVHLESDEFSLSAPRIELRWETSQLKVEIPQRFRMNLRHEFIEELKRSLPAPHRS